MKICTAAAAGKAISDNYPSLSFHLIAEAARVTGDVNLTGVRYLLAHIQQPDKNIFLDIIILSAYK
ncbi:MAG TPA: hypothetical protein VKE70_03135 [Candidatus Solibacter sp.]|nr:hypothetical protein [Candidatus Solibacter sp.]